MTHRKFFLYGLIFLLVLVAAGAGLLYQGQGAPISVTTVRGEHATYQSTGLYRFNPASVVNEGIVWDAIDIVLALPLFAAAIWLDRRTSLRGRLLLLGVLFYFTYKYLQYAVMLAFNPLFLVYVAIFALSGVAFFIALAGIDVARLPEHIADRFPHRLIIGFTSVMGVALILMWLGRIIPYTLADRFPDEFRHDHPGDAGPRPRHGGAADARHGGTALAALDVGLPPGRYQHHLRFHYVDYTTGVDCRAAHPGWAGQPHRGRAVLGAVPHRAVRDVAVFPQYRWRKG